jgi:Protein of unknown function (DUF1194)/PEP-CTERM motif
MKIRSLIKVTALTIPLLFGASFSQAKSIGIALLIDGSGSIGAADYALQVQAYQNVLSGTFFTDEVLSRGFDTIEFNTWIFATGVVACGGPTTVTSNATSTAYGNVIAGCAQTGGSTNTALAINTATAWLSSLTVDRTVTDISTDGDPCCGGSAVQDAIDAGNASRAAGHRVNAIGVGGPSIATLNAITDAGGGNPLSGFVLTAANFADFEAALRQKIPREIPVPGTLLLLGMGLLGLGARRRQAA